jgi:hypothetical protein
MNNQAQLQVRPVSRQILMFCMLNVMFLLQCEELRNEAKALAKVIHRIRTNVFTI